MVVVGSIVNHLMGDLGSWQCRCVSRYRAGGGSCWHVREKKIDKRKSLLSSDVDMLGAGNGHHRHRARPGLRLGSSRIRGEKLGMGD